MSVDRADVIKYDFIAGTVTVSTTQTLLKAGATNLSGRQIITIYNSGNHDIYVGPSGVTTSTGIRIFKRQTITFPYGDGINLYAITSTSTSDVVVHEAG
jgi:hypothetical protein